MTALELLVRIAPDDARPIYVQIMDEMQRLIATGKMIPGAPVPSIRILAAHLRVSHLTVFQAYRELERIGVFEVQRGRGTIVSPRTSPAVERKKLAERFARHTLIEASRNGLSGEELVQTLQRVLRTGPLKRGDA